MCGDALERLSLMCSAEPGGDGQMNNDRLIQQYSSLARFIILFFIWGTAGSKFKLYMDLSAGGLVLSMLFFGASTLVILGWKTRSSMIALAATLLAHAVLLHAKTSLAGAGLAALSILFPIGACYSLDSYQHVPAPAAPYLPSTPEADRQAPPWTVPLFIALLIIIVGGPTYNQVLNRNSRWLRAWDMYHVIGQNLVNARFFETTGTGRRRIDYMEVLGHKNQAPGVFRDWKAQPETRIVGTDNLEGLIQQLCKTVVSPDSLRLEAKIATLKEGWKTLYNGSEPVCETRDGGQVR